jgi:hypothetical protein
MHVTSGMGRGNTLFTKEISENWAAQISARKSADI